MYTHPQPLTEVSPMNFSKMLAATMVAGPVAAAAAAAGAGGAAAAPVALAMSRPSEHGALPPDAEPGDATSSLARAA